MSTKDFTTTIMTGRTPAEVYEAVNNVAAWWTTAFTGASQAVGDEFEVRFGDIHYSRQRLVEMIPGKKIVWLVTDSCLTFLQDKSEWNGTRILFEVTEQGSKTQLRLTHEGLVPEVECYEACSPAWGQYMKYSLLSLLNTGVGQPGFPPAGPLMSDDLMFTITVSKTPAQAFNAITDMRAWWSEEIKGETNGVDAIFDYHHRDVHRCKMRLAELVPEKRVAWVVTENYFDFVTDQDEWVGTRVIFDLAAKENGTQITFTHQGLAPQHECYDICANAWSGYITGSLRDLIETGKGRPNPKEV